MPVQELERLQKAQTEFRVAAARMRAFVLNETSALWLVRLCGHDPRAASKYLIGLSNSIGIADDQKEKQRNGLAKALKFDLNSV